MTVLYLDIETLLLFSDPEIKARHTRELQLQALPFAVAVSYCDERGWETWLPDSLLKLWTLMLSADQVVNWTLIDFDLPVMAANLARMMQVPVEAIRRPRRLFDPFALIERATGRMERLEVIAQANLGRGKRGSGIEAVAWLRSGDPALFARAVDYCRGDVELVIDLHRLILARAWLHLPAQPDRPGRNRELWVRVAPSGSTVDLRWSRPEEWASPASTGA